MEHRPSEGPPATAPAVRHPLDVVELLGVGQDHRTPTRADLLARVAVLEGKLASQPEIEQAKGALMLAYGLSADAAFALLRFHSQHRNVKIRAIATQLTDLMVTSPSSVEAISRFNALLDQVARNEQRAVPDASRRPAPRDGADAVTLSADLGPAELPDVMLTAVAVAPPGITIAGNGPDMPLIYANSAFSELTGYPIHEVIGRNCRFLQGRQTDPDDVAAVSRALHRGQDVTVVIRNYRSDGGPFWNELSISPIRDRDQQVTHYVATQIDITPQLDRQHSDAR